MRPMLKSIRAAMSGNKLPDFQRKRRAQVWQKRLLVQRRQRARAIRVPQSAQKFGLYMVRDSVYAKLL
jgi:hypothetical protein